MDLEAFAERHRRNPRMSRPLCWLGSLAISCGLGGCGATRDDSLTGCSPIEVYSGSAPILDFTVLGDSIYLALSDDPADAALSSEKGRIVVADSDGSVRTLAEDQINPIRLAANDAGVFWTTKGHQNSSETDEDSTVMALLAGEIEPRTVAGGLSEAMEILVDDSGLYWTCGGRSSTGHADGSVMAADLDLTRVRVLASEQYFPYSLAKSGDLLWFGTPDELKSVSLADASQTVVGDSFYPNSLTSDDAELYFPVWQLNEVTGQSQYSSRIRALSLRTGDARTVAATELAAQNLVMDDSYVFWTSLRTDPDMGETQVELTAARKVGGKPQLVRSIRDLGRLHRADGVLYFSTASSVWACGPR